MIDFVIAGFALSAMLAYTAMQLVDADMRRTKQRAACGWARHAALMRRIAADREAHARWYDGQNARALTRKEASR